MDDYALLRVRLTPKGGRDALMRREGGILYVRVAAPPVEGAANRALIALLAKTLGAAKSRITIQTGETGRDKSLRIEGMDSAALDAKLQTLLKT